MFRTTTLIALTLFATNALAQCPRPDIFNHGGVSHAICAGVSGYQAIAHGRIIRMVHATGASPAPAGEIALNDTVRHMHSQVSGKIWAVDNDTVYGIDVSIATSPHVVGQLKIPLEDFENLNRIRVHGNRLYIISQYDRLHIVDISNEAAPVLLSSFRALDRAGLTDVEVIGSYAYISTEHSFEETEALMVVDISNPVQPVEVSRFGDGMGLHVATSPGNPYLYSLTRRGVRGFIERWSLANPVHPELVASSPQLTNGREQDELLVSLNAVCHMAWFDQVGTDALRLFDLNTLAQIGQAQQVPQFLTAMGIDPPYVFLAHDMGQIDRFNILNASVPLPVVNYYDLAPGKTFEIASINSGYSVVSHERSLWFFKTQASGAASLIGHVLPASGGRFVGPAVLINDIVYVEEYNPTASMSFIRAYRVNPLNSPFVTLVGGFSQPGYIYSFDVGDDQTFARRIYYTTIDSGTGTLHVLNATNPAAMTHSGSSSLTAGAYSPVRFIGGSTLFGTPDRAIIGGTTTQILNVNNANGIFPLGVVPADSTRCLARGVINQIWLISGDSKLRAYDISTPATPAHLSTLQLPRDASGFRFINPFGARAAVVADGGLLVRIDTANASAPAIAQIAKVADRVNAFAWDGTLLHFAADDTGYTVLPTDFDARPAEDTNAPLSKLGKERIMSICPGTPLSIPTHFVAIPAVSSYQWYKYNVALNALDTIGDGPTGTGSTISGTATATLTISNPGGADNGSYYCRATNTCGTSDYTGAYARLYGYANCDNSTVAPVLNVNDFQCFMNKFAAEDPWYPNCDGSTAQPVLNVNDFQCFLNTFATACQ